MWQGAAGLGGAAKESEAGIQECLLPMTLILVIIYWHLPHSNDLNSIALGYNEMGRSSQPLSQPTATRALLLLLLCHIQGTPSNASSAWRALNKGPLYSKYDTYCCLF